MAYDIHHVFRAADLPPVERGRPTGDGTIFSTSGWVRWWWWW